MTKIGQELDCGCELWSTLGRPDISFCPKHKAALELAGVVRQFIRYCEQWQRANGDFPNGDGRTLILKNARQAEAKPEGGSDDIIDRERIRTA